LKYCRTTYDGFSAFTEAQRRALTDVDALANTETLGNAMHHFRCFHEEYLCIGIFVLENLRRPSMTTIKAKYQSRIIVGMLTISLYQYFVIQTDVKALLNILPSTNTLLSESFSIGTV
jgi:hypothetical protein